MHTYTEEVCFRGGEKHESVMLVLTIIYCDLHVEIAVPGRGMNSVVIRKVTVNHHVREIPKAFTVHVYKKNLDACRQSVNVWSKHLHQL